MEKTKKEDLRVKKTKESIKGAFIDLVGHKGYRNVSVSDIVKYAQINRNTFYLHYEDKEHLVKSLIMEASFLMNSALDTYVKNTSFPFDRIKEIEIRYGLRNILKYITPEIELYRVMLLDDSLRGYMQEPFDMIKDYLAKLLKIQNPRSNLIFEYTMNGMIGILTQYIIYSPVSLSATAKILARLTYNDLQQFKEINIK